jgi:transglutaminase-like putative cysteine protease
MSIDPLFPGYAEIPAPADDPVWRKWDTVSSALDVEYEAIELTLSDVARFNEQINRDVPYVSEPLGLDAWQTPTQTMTAQSGDCEDFAILKYAVMKRSGLPGGVDADRARPDQGAQRQSRPRVAGGPAR